MYVVIISLSFSMKIQEFGYAIEKYIMVWGVGITSSGAHVYLERKRIDTSKVLEINFLFL